PAAPVNHLGPELLGAEPRILLGFGAPQAVVHVQRRDPVAELAQDVPEAGRIGPAGDQAGHLTPALNQLPAADEVLDALWQLHEIISRLQDVAEANDFQKQRTDPSSTKRAGG